MNNNWYDLSNADNIYNNIVSKIIGSQQIGKCLKYTTADALEKPDLTQEEIFALVNQTNRSACRIFNIPPTYYVTEEQRAEIRVYETAIASTNQYIYDIGYCFDVVCHQELWLLEDGSRRVMKIMSGIMEMLNGVDVGGLGKMRFFSDRKPEILKLQFYNDVTAGYKLFAFVTSGGTNDRLG